MIRTEAPVSLFDFSFFFLIFCYQEYGRCVSRSRKIASLDGKVEEPRSSRTISNDLEFVLIFARVIFGTAQPSSCSSSSLMIFPSSFFSLYRRTSFVEDSSSFDLPDFDRRGRSASLQYEMLDCRGGSGLSMPLRLLREYVRS